MRRSAPSYRCCRWPRATARCSSRRRRWRMPGSRRASPLGRRREILQDGPTSRSSPLRTPAASNLWTVRQWKRASAVQRKGHRPRLWPASLMIDCKETSIGMIGRSGWLTVRLISPRFHTNSKILQPSTDLKNLCTSFLFLRQIPAGPFRFRRRQVPNQYCWVTLVKLN